MQAVRARSNADAECFSGFDFVASELLQRLEQPVIDGRGYVRPVPGVMRVTSVRQE
jgi:hypothetical protein